MKKTIVLGASPNPVRFSYKAVRSLKRHDIEVIPIGFRKGLIEDIEIFTGQPDIKDVHTVSLYIGSSRQTEYYDYIISLNPKRVIFNPGTVNSEFLLMLAEEADIEAISECMLVMLNEGEF